MSGIFTNIYLYHRNFLTMNFIKYLCIFVISFSLFFCGGTSFLKTEKTISPVTEDFPILLKIESSKDISIYRYTSPSKLDLSYSSVVLDPIAINSDHFDPKMTPLIEKIKFSMADSLKKKLDQNTIPVSENGSESTARISLFLSSVKLKPESLKPWNFLPLSALVTATVYVAGYNSKSLDLLIECKITNSETNELITKDLIILSSDKFRNKNRTLEIFNILGNKALDQIFKGSILPIVFKK
jgi:hypothetical protein